MTFSEALNFLFDLRRFPPRQDVAATESLLSHVDDPHETLACVQIAGSNGKGSTARMVESTLLEAGLEVGLYTSPHLDDVRERIRINGRPIAERSVVAFVDSVGEYVTEAAVDGDAPTFFEALTALALWEFDRQDVDVALLEVGIGGRYDATSVVEPVASAVTTVALEHTSMLGDDVGTIARDKAQVAPAARPLVTGATGDALAAIEDEVGRTVRVGSEGDVRVSYEGRVGIESAVEIETDGWSLETNLALLGEHQARNAGVAIALVHQLADALELSVPDATLARGLRNAHWPGRFEIVGRDPLVVLDGAHNPAGCAVLAETLAEFSVDRLHVVFGAMADKDHRAMAAALAGADDVIVSEPETERAADAAVLARAFERETGARVERQDDVASALETALARAGTDDCVLVTGSLYCISEARSRWTRPYVRTHARSPHEARRILEDAHVTGFERERSTGAVTHHVLRTRLRPRQATTVQAAFRAVGGECAVSAVDHPEEPRPVVLMGTTGQFEALCARLDRRGSVLAGELRDALDLSSDADRGGQTATSDEATYPWERGTAVMGILNVTPDSFHDGGEYELREDATARAREMVEHGAALVDVGGESTRPGAEPVDAETERERVVPVVEALSDLDVLVSVDTRKAAVARAALDAGADVLNDVSGLADPDMRLVAAEYDVPVVVMHSIDTPVVPDRDVHYDDVVEDVRSALAERVLLAERAGLDRSQIIVDPGLGFGKRAPESFELLDRLEEFRTLGCPVLVGHSHKSMFDHVGCGPEERYEPTVAATALATERGADIVRVHDVAANVAAVDVVEAAREHRR